MVDGKHCTFPHLPGKNFVYNAAEDRLELCVDAAGHFPIGPDVEDLVKEALSQVRAEATSRSREASPSHGMLKLGSGGVVKKKSEQLHNITAFQGKGHSLGTASGSQQHDQRAREAPLLRKHSTETDFSPAKIEPSVFPAASAKSGDRHLDNASCFSYEYSQSISLWQGRCSWTGRNWQGGSRPQPW